MAPITAPMRASIIAKGSTRSPQHVAMLQVAMHVAMHMVVPHVAMPPRTMRAFGRRTPAAG